MSNSDPDLQPREENDIVAADVVDGQLILRRRGGRKELFPMGGGIVERPILNLQFSSDGDIAPNNGAYLKIIGGYLTPSDDPNTVLQEFDDTASVPEGYAVGDEYVLKRTINGETSSDTVLFKKKGLYHLVQDSGTEVFGAGSMFYTSYNGVRNSVMVNVPQGTVPPLGTMPLVVGEVDLAASDLSSGAELGVFAQSGPSTGSNLSFSANISITRII